MILGSKVTNPGELRTPILLLKRTITTQPGGFQVPSISTIAACYARWENTHGSDVWKAAQIAQESATLLIRYNSQVDTTCLVSREGVLYEIISVDNIQQRSEYMELTVKRMPAAEG